MEHTSSLSAMKHVAGNKNEPATKGNTRDRFCFVLVFCITEAAGRSHGAVGGYQAFCWLREETHLPFKDKLNGAWIMPRGWPDSVICRDQATFDYLPMHLTTDNSLVPCRQNVFVKTFGWNQHCKAARLDLSQEKLTQIPLGWGQPPWPHWWDCWVTGVKELESGTVT